MTIEGRLAVLEKKLHRTRLLLAALLVGLLLVCTVAANGPFVDLVCRSLMVKNSDGKTVTELTPDGSGKVGKDLTVGGKLTVGEVDVAARLVKAEARLASLSDYLRQLSEKGIVGEPQKMNPYQQYKAESDGIVMAVTGGAPMSIELTLMTTSPGNQTVVRRASHGASGLYASVTGVVRKGSTWTVETHNAKGNVVNEPQNVTVWFVPISIPQPPADEAGKK